MYVSFHTHGLTCQGSQGFPSTDPRHVKNMCMGHLILWRRSNQCHDKHKAVIVTFEANLTCHGLECGVCWSLFHMIWFSSLIFSTFRRLFFDSLSRKETQTVRAYHDVILFYIVFARLETQTVILLQQKQKTLSSQDSTAIGAGGACCWPSLVCFFLWCIAHVTQFVLQYATQHFLHILWSQPAPGWLFWQLVHILSFHFCDSRY